MTDKRYSIRLEYCGYARRRWVVRFCHGWIGTGANRADADAIAQRHAAARLATMDAAT